MKTLLADIRNCTLCTPHLAHAPRPVLSASAKAHIVVVGQAPGRVVHENGVPWDDQSGENLRSWMGIDRTTFYDQQLIALVPMGFCFPGTGKSGDLPPRKECAPLWHPQLFDAMPEVQLILLVGSYAQNYYLEHPYSTLTENVAHFNDFLPRYFVLPHPSPRNNIWQAAHPWFREEVLPEFRQRIHAILHA